MKLKEELTLAIEDEAAKLALRFHAYHNGLELEYQRRKKAVVNAGSKVLLTPAEWASDRKFNPFYVSKRKGSIAHSISKKIIEGTYQPGKPVLRKIRKMGGGFRDICVYQIPDAAVSTLIYRQLLRKNRHRFSGSSYAYRDDRNAHFAIQDISVEFAKHSRLFIAEYDFSKFFDSISHSYLREQFDKNGFSISDHERRLIDTFLLSEKGIPQGTSISLFLANLVCWQLDRDLEEAGVRFARYADDTVVWSPDHSKVSKAVDIIAQFSKETEVPINYKKSKGIRLLCANGVPAEFDARTSQFDFLGYSVGIDSIGIKETSVRRIKRQISYLLYRHLIQPLRGPKLVALDIPANGQDKALAAAIGAIRRYLYGNLSDEYIRRYLTGSSGRLFYKGVMSFYPLLSDKAQMQELDGWLISQVWKATQLRARLLLGWKYDRRHNFPFNVRRGELAEKFRDHKSGPHHYYAVPSFVVIYLALRKAVSENGILQMLAVDDY